MEKNFQRRPNKEETVVSKDIDFQVSYSKLIFQVDYPTDPGQSVYILGNVEELGNEDENKSVKLKKKQENSNVWESESPLECAVGMTIKYKFLTIDSNNNKIYEELGKDEIRSITTKKEGNFIILNQKGKLDTKLIICDSENDAIHKNASEFISYLSPRDLLSYENNMSNFDLYNDVINSEQDKILNEEKKVILATMYLPCKIKKEKNEYIIEEDENSFFLKYIYKYKMSEKKEFCWVGMLKNYFDFKPEEIPEIEKILVKQKFFMIKPKTKKKWYLYLFYIEHLMGPIFYNSSFNPNDKSLADNYEYFQAFYEISKNFGETINSKCDDEKNEERDSRVDEYVILQGIGLSFVPNILMNKKKTTHIGLYIHSILPPYDIIKIFPNHWEILNSILLCDVIGFHDYKSARNFLTIMKRVFGIFSQITKKGIIILPYYGRNVIIHIKQPQIDYNYIQELQKNKKFIDYDKKFEQKYKDNKLTITSFDYIFTLSAIMNKIKAFDLFLGKNKELIQNCNIIMWIRTFEESLKVDLEDDDYDENFENEKKNEENSDEEEEEEDDDKDRKKNKCHLIKSELSIKDNHSRVRDKMQKYKDRIEEEIKKINHKYKDKNDKIIVVNYFHNEDTFNIYKRLAMFKHCNIFVYPFFLEGLGIYVKEFIAMKNENSKKYGAIVSENMPYMGIRSIIKVNPYDSVAISEAMNSINSWESNKVRMEYDFDSIQKKNSTKIWINYFLLDMKRVMLNDSNNKETIGMGKDLSIMKLNDNFKQIKKANLERYFKYYKSRLLVFNLENTLQEFDEQNNDFSEYFTKNISETVINTITSLCEDPKNMVFIISKYDHETLNKIFGGIKNLGLCGENGFYYKYPGEKEFKPLLTTLDNSWKETALKIMKNFAERIEGSKIIKHESKLCFSFKKIDYDFGLEQAEELKNHLSAVLSAPSVGITILSNGTLEIGPKNVNKGAFLAKVLQEKYDDRKFELLFIVGNDETDEEMYKYIYSAKKYFYNFVKNFKTVLTKVQKDYSLANYFFNNPRDCMDNLEYVTRRRQKENDERVIINFEEMED